METGFLRYWLVYFLFGECVKQKYVIIQYFSATVAKTRFMIYSKEFIGEALGTFILVLFGCGSVAASVLLMLTRV